MTRNRDAILKAFRDSEYRWRTARGLSKDTGLPIQDVTKFLESSRDLKRTEFSDEREGLERLFVGRYPLLHE